MSTDFWMVFIFCVREGTQLREMAIWPGKRSDRVDLGLQGTVCVWVCVHQRIRANCDMTPAPGLHHDKDLCVCSARSGTDNGDCWLQGKTVSPRRQISSLKRLRHNCAALQNPAYSYVSLLILAKLMTGFGLTDYQGNRTHGPYVWHHGIIRPRSAPMSTPALICILICC